MEEKKPLTNMEGRWVESTKEAFDALVAMGYKAYEDMKTTIMGECIRIWDCDGDGVFIYSGPISSPYTKNLKISYFYQGQFWDEPEEVDEKVLFPELEDIDWVMVEAPEWFGNSLFVYEDCIGKFYNLDLQRYETFKLMHESSKDFKVTWKLKDKIDRRLHVNRQLALDIGRWIDKNGSITFYGTGIQLEMVSVTGLKFAVAEHKRNGVDDGIVDEYITEEFTLPDDYIIPDEVMKEYKCGTVESEK